jgi:cell division protein FtsN
MERQRRLNKSLNAKPYLLPEGVQASKISQIKTTTSKDIPVYADKPTKKPFQKFKLKKKKKVLDLTPKPLPEAPQKTEEEMKQEARYR